LKHVDVTGRLLRQDARDVRTKASKTMETWFFPAGEDFVAIVEEWVAFLRQERQWGLDDPLFPATKIAIGPSRRFEAVGLERACWGNVGPIRKVFKEAFTAAGLVYFNPHSLRRTLARLGQERCRTPEEFKAWSQNLGHEQVLTTLTSYGQVDRLRQRDIIQGLWRPKESMPIDTDALIRQFAQAVRAANPTV
jgi:integrase